MGGTVCLASMKWAYSCIRTAVPSLHSTPATDSYPSFRLSGEDPTNVGIYSLAFFATTLGIIYVQASAWW